MGPLAGAQKTTFLKNGGKKGVRVQFLENRRKMGPGKFAQKYAENSSFCLRHSLRGAPVRHPFFQSSFMGLD